MAEFLGIFMFFFPWGGVLDPSPNHISVRCNDPWRMGRWDFFRGFWGFCWNQLVIHRDIFQHLGEGCLQTCFQSQKNKCFFWNKSRQRRFPSDIHGVCSVWKLGRYPKTCSGFLPFNPLSFSEGFLLGPSPDVPPKHGCFFLKVFLEASTPRPF